MHYHPVFAQVLISILLAPRENRLQVKVIQIVTHDVCGKPHPHVLVLPSAICMSWP